MLSRERRLTSDWDFKMVRQRGKKIRTPLFDLCYLSKKGNLPSRFGFVISTKLDKRAAKRNRIKRIFREEAKATLSKVKHGFDLVFLVKKEALGAEPDRVRKIIREVLEKRRLLTND